MIKRLFPFIAWRLDTQTLRADLLAGMTVALVLIPQSMAYAQLAGLPAYFGLYIAFLPVVVAALWGSSAQLATGPVAIVSLMTAGALAPLLGGTALSHPELASEYLALAMLMALLVGLVQLALGFLRLGDIVRFLSQPVIVGFTNAAALVIGLSQLAKLFGLSVSASAGEHFLSAHVWRVMQQLGQTHLPSLAMGIGSLVLMVLMKRYAPALPAVLLAVVITTLISWLIGYEKQGGEVVGAVPAGMPPFALPSVDTGLVVDLLPSALVIALVGFMEAISIARAMAARTREPLDPNQELIGQGLANIASAFSQAYPASGSFSRSAVNFSAGARSGMSSVFTGLMVLITLLLLTPLLYHLPNAVLASVIMVSVFGLLNFGAMRRSWRLHRHDGLASMVTFTATLALAPAMEQGVVLGAVISLLLALYRSRRHGVGLGLGKKGNRVSVAMPARPEFGSQLKVVHLRGVLYFGNIGPLEEALRPPAGGGAECRYLLLVGKGIEHMDATAEAMLQRTLERLQASGVSVALSGLNSTVTHLLHAAGLHTLIGRENIFASETEAIEVIRQRLSLVSARV